MQFSFELRMRQNILREISFMISSTLDSTEFVQLILDGPTC